MYIVIDTETTMRNKGEDAIGEFSASPWHPENEIVMFYAKGEVWLAPGAWKTPATVPWDRFDLVIGHNIKFDLAYLCKEDMRFKKEFSRIMIWDTMLAEYILNGQDTTYPSLDETAPKYGGTLKDSRVKHMMDAGICPSEYPKELLEEYLIGDVTNTELVFLGQLKRAQDQGMINLITTKMMALKATFSMEWNGMKFDRVTAYNTALLLRNERGKIANDIYEVFEKYLPHKTNINIASPQQLSLVLFGGTYEFPIKKEMGVYKSGIKKGQPKYKTEWLEHNIEGFGIPPKVEWKTKIDGVYQTNDDIIESLLMHSIGGTLLPFLNNIKRYRELNKEIETYYEGYSKLVWHDGFIHPTYNHTATKTGRLSCSAPNLQNVTRADE